MSRPYQMCTRCVMDTGDPLIEFDEEGRCNLCTDYLENRLPYLRERQQPDDSIEHFFDRVRQTGRGQKYDCLVGVSGGVDSSYLAALAVEHGLRPLAVHLDNGWNSKVAVENIRRLATKLNIGYASYVLPWTEFRQVQLAFLKASIPEAETPTDVAIARAMHHYAARNNIKYILSGGNLASEGILPKTWHYNSRDTKYAYAILDAAGVPRSHYKALKFGARQEGYCKAVRGIKMTYPLNHITYDKTAARAKLENEYGWQYYGSKHGESRYTRFIQNYYLYVKHGIDYRRATMSSEIMLGVISREAALEILEGPPYAQDDIKAEIEYVSKKLGITTAELEAIIAAPPRYYFDYSNNEKPLSVLYAAYRKMTGRKKTSNF
jgi:N-acetyl sugar amidotransferase